MTQTHPQRNCQPTITVAQDGPGWWRYQAVLNGQVVLAGYCKGKRTEAQREAEYRLKARQTHPGVTAR